MKRLRLQAQTGNLDQAVSFVAQCAKVHGFSEDRTLSVELVVEEVFVNVCMYAYEDEKGHIEINCRTGSSPERLTLEILDEGKPFNPLSAVPANDQDVDLTQRRVGGLGILMIIQMTDEVTYERIGESNLLTLYFDRFRRSGQQRSRSRSRTSKLYK
jgi:anti-sigma regulatory factor (Ser/Thr protein kinase)